MKGLFNLLVLVGIFSVNFTFSQKEGNIWYFGNKAGVDFNSGSPVALLNSAMNQWEGCASIADKDGNLLFYTNGVQVWNKNHAVMQNGNNLSGHSSSTQSAIIVPWPGIDSLYYIFTVDAFGGGNGLRYSIVNIKKNNGEGEILTSSKNTAIIAPTAEKVTAVLHKNQKDIWVITHGSGNNRFYSYLVSNTGINLSPVITEIGLAHTGGVGFDALANDIGYMKASPDGKKVAVAIQGPRKFELFDFDNSSGKLSNAITFPKKYEQAHGVEFSPDGTKLYYSHIPNGTDMVILQIDLQAGNGESSAIINSITEIVQKTGVVGGALQLGPDRKIYFSRHLQTHLGVINNPNEKGAACNYVDEGVYLQGKVCQLGLPSFIQSIFAQINFDYENICLGDNTEFFIADSAGCSSISWDFGDPSSGAENFSTQYHPKHKYALPGSYSVQLTGIKNGIADTIIKTIIIHELPQPTLTDTFVCNKESFPLILNANNNSISEYLWNDGSTASSLSINEHGEYHVQLTSIYGCVTIDNINVNECGVEIPNIISANADGTNDYFAIRGISNKSWKLTIFNRWGTPVYEDENYANTWTAEGLKNGVYYYVLSSIDMDLKGFVTVVR